MKKFVSILLVIIMCLSYHFILVVHASTLDAKSDSAVMQAGKSTQAQTDKPDNEAGAGAKDEADHKDDAASGASMSEVSLCIDNKNVYDGMQQAYANGYQPVCANGNVTLVLPLISDGKLQQDKITASVDLGATDSSVFVFRSYEKEFNCKPEYINGTGETKDIFLVSFELTLSEKRVNGIYPVIINVSGKDENGIEVQKSFTNFVTVADGIDPNAAASGAADTTQAEETPTSAPVVLVDKSVINTDMVKAGEDFEVTVTLKNTSRQKSVQNLVATVNVPSADIELKNDSNTIFIGKIGTQKTTELTLKFHASKSTADGNYPIEIAMSYDDPKASTLSSTGSFVVTVEQPLDVKLTMPNIDKNVTAGDTIPLTFQVMNLGRSTVYNVRCDVTGDGLSQTRTAFIGNMESGTAGEGETNLFITTLEGKSQYGDTTGTVTLTYEDGFGNEQTQEFSFNTTINKMPDEASTGDEKKEKSASQWWISLAVIGGLIILVGAVSGAYYMGRKKR